MNKKGYSTGMAWVYGIVSMFGLGVIYMAGTQMALTAYLKPVLENYITEVSTIPMETQTTILANYDQIFKMLNYLPFVLFFIIIVFLFVVGFRKEEEEYYEQPRG